MHGPARSRINSIALLNYLARLRIHVDIPLLRRVSV